MRDRARRLHCRLFGCIESQYAPVCDRCGLYYYEGFVFSDESRIRGPWLRLVYWVRGLNPIKTCCHCRRRFFDRKNESCCSERCYQEWIPF